MASYESLAQFYDLLTGDVPYDEFAAFYEKLLDAKERKVLLDLGCGTGTLSWLLASHGHEMICVDPSSDMLAAAAAKSVDAAAASAPMFICQSAEELDLFGTVSGAICSLDAVNYMPPGILPAVFARLHLFIEPGGVFAFDIHSPEHLMELDGETFVDEDKDVLCLWRAEFDKEENALFYGMDIFMREGSHWRRTQEEHIEYAHDPKELCTLLQEAGFCETNIITDGVQNEMGRLFITARRK